MSQNVLRLPAVIARTGLSRSTLYRFIAEGKFPKPILIGARAIGFVETEIDDWIEARIRVSRQGRDK